MQQLDAQIGKHSARLVSEVGLDVAVAQRLATTVAAEVRFLPVEAKAQIIESSPVVASARLDELVGFQALMDQLRAKHPHPALVRAQVVYQNYICFVYLGEACFRILAKTAPPGSVTRRCSQFLTNNPVRAFRNAIAHGNWSYTADFTGITFWARKGSDPKEPLAQFQVLQDELGFWQALARCVGYATYLHIQSGGAA